MIGIHLDEQIPVNQVITRLQVEGLLTLSAGDNTLRLLPPIVMQPADLLAGIALIAKVLTTLTTEVTTNE
jgi:acetylornithine aminotransferase